MQDWFIERREVSEVVHQRSGLRVLAPTREQGYALRREGRGGLEHTWTQVADGRLTPGALPTELLAPAQALLAPAPTVPDTAWAEELVRHLVETARGAGATHLDLLLRETGQRTLFANDSQVLQDRRHHAILEVKVSLATASGTAELWRSMAYPDGARMHAALPELEALVLRLTRQLQECTPVIPCPTGTLPIVFPPGAASACFFHEVCGHPLEGDVTARGGSYLARRLGQRVAEDFVSVSDDPTDGHSALAYTWDDEGSPAQSVPLLRAGHVGVPLLHTQSARALGHALNGHGRRVDFRHPPLPRMAHTRVEPHQGRLESLLAPLSHGLLVRHLTPRHMNLLSGDFSFYIIEAQEIRDGQPGRLVGPGILSGNGLEALASIDAVGADLQNLFATRGCRKLNHGPLSVSFGQPSIRFRQLHLRPWR